MKVASLFEVIGILVGLFVAIALNAWVISVLYDWFVLPVFTSAPKLSVVQVAGCALFFRAMRGWRVGPSGGPKIGALLAAAVAMDLLMLAVGGCVALIASL